MHHSFSTYVYFIFYGSFICFILLDFDQDPGAGLALPLPLARTEPRVLWDRTDPLVHFNDRDFRRHFRFTKPNMLQECFLLPDNIQGWGSYF